MASDLSSTEVNEVKEEENLLIEAISLLVQRQREMEGWVSEQVWQAEERAATTERRYTDLETRLAGIEEQLNRLTRDFEPGRGDAAADERLARLREQVEGLKSVGGGDSRPARGSRETSPAHEPTSPPATRFEPASARMASTKPAVHEPAPPSPRYEPEPPPEPRYVPPPQPARRSVPRQTEPVASVAPAGRPTASPSFMELLGSSSQDRMGLILIGVGLVAVLYAFLTQVKLG